MTKSRLVFIDLLRGWATIVMVEVHVFNAFLLPQIKAESWFRGLNFINGLVAPSFIFIAGFVFVVASARKLDEFRTYGAAFWRQLSRIGLIWATGYFLHLPFYSLARTVNETSADGWLRFFQVDVLQCIAVGIAILFVLRLTIRDDRMYRRVLAVFGLGFIVAAPFLWDRDFVGTIPAFFAAHLNGQHHSLFPLFPWLGFLLSGGFVASEFMMARDENREKQFLQKIGLIAFVTIVLGLTLPELSLRIPHASLDARANPLFFAERLGIVLALLLLCWLYTQWRATDRGFVIDISKESLLVYTVHLVIIYGIFLNGASLASIYGGTLTLLQCTVATLGLIMLMVVLSKAWGRVKQSSRSTARAISFGTISIVVFFFIVR